MRFKTMLFALGFAASGAWAFDPDLGAIEDASLSAKYPKGSIVTVETANHAVEEVKAARKALKEKTDYATRRCGENFFVNRCIDSVRKAGIRQERRLLAVESDAKAVIRTESIRKEAAEQARRDRKAKDKSEKLSHGTHSPKTVGAPRAAKPSNHGERAAEKARKREAAHQRKVAQESKSLAASKKREADRQQRALKRQKKIADRQKKESSQSQSRKKPLL